MQRVVIYGCSGSGKSTFACRLGSMTGLPVVHIDQLFWLAGWRERPKDEFFCAMQQIVDTDRWIIEGGSLSTFPMRLARADTLVLFKRGRLICLWRVLKRVSGSYGRVRSDMAPGCPERFSLSFMVWIWNFERRYAEKAAALVAAHGSHLKVFTVRSDADADDILQMAT